jgi:hypothetical protein
MITRELLNDQGLTPRQVFRITHHVKLVREVELAPPLFSSPSAPSLFAETKNSVIDPA